MSLPADFDLKERVRSAVDIVDVIGATIEIQPQGRNFVARCPWHNDRRPSMTVNRERQSWKCWPCDIGGDVFSFVMRRDGVDFPTALRTLAEQAAIPIESFQRGKKTKPGAPDDRETLLNAVKLVRDEYFRLLEDPRTDDAKLARDYLSERGIDDENRRCFQIGFAPDKWSHAVDLLARHQFSGEVALAAGLASNRSGGGFVDMFRGRLMFPIHDLQGRPISLGGRVIPAIAERHGENAGGKYINGRETQLFRKSSELFGLNLARDAIRKDGHVLVMEGYTDVIAARQAGIQSAVAVLGTALTSQHVTVLRRFADRVVLVLDGDAAGQRRANEVLELFVSANIDLRVLTLPEEDDPADYLAKHGRESLERAVAEAPDALDHRLQTLTRGIDVARDTHAVTAAVDTMLGVIAKSPRDGLRTDQMVVRMSKLFELKPERLERRLEHFRGEVERRGQRSRPPQRDRPPASRAAPAADPNLAFAESAFEAEQTEGHSRSEAPSALPALFGIDLQLFETLVENPELAAMAVESVDANWLESMTGKMLLSAYQDLEMAGHPLDPETLMLVIENESLKNVLVTLEERVQRRGEKLAETSEQRFSAIMIRYRDREFAAQRALQIQQLESAELGEDEEDELLRTMFEQERSRHQIPKPESQVPPKPSSFPSPRAKFPSPRGGRTCKASPPPLAPRALRAPHRGSFPNPSAS